MPLCQSGTRGIGGETFFLSFFKASKEGLALLQAEDTENEVPKVPRGRLPRRRRCGTVGAGMARPLSGNGDELRLVPHELAFGE